jgi:hypothetical protein
MQLKDALEDEIAFWHSLIDSQDKDTPPQVIERMVQARMLAEQKLSLLNCNPQETPQPSQVT